MSPPRSGCMCYTQLMPHLRAGCISAPIRGYISTPPRVHTPSVRLSAPSNGASQAPPSIAPGIFQIKSKSELETLCLCVCPVRGGGGSGGGERCLSAIPSLCAPQSQPRPVTHSPPTPQKQLHLVRGWWDAGLPWRLLLCGFRLIRASLAGHWAVWSVGGGGGSFSPSPFGGQCGWGGLLHRSQERGARKGLGMGRLGVRVFGE